jgi:2-dehydropantoate 2-reductase
MHFAVIGAGNIGCIYGSNLSRMGHRVTMIDTWVEQVQQMQEKGLAMTGRHGDFVADVEATSKPSSAAKADVALICVNAYHTRDAAKSASVVLKETGYALTLQNGLGNIEILADILGVHKVMAGLTFHSADLTEPGRVTHTNEGPTYLGELDNSKSLRLTELESVMQQAGMNPVLEEAIMATIWSKFLHNCGINAICAITDLRPGHIQDVSELEEFQTRVIEEAQALLQASGIKSLDSDPVRTIKSYCSDKFHRVSMTQHLSRARPTEIDALNGYVVRKSLELGLQAPNNDAITRLIKGLEHRPEDA